MMVSFSHDARQYHVTQKLTLSEQETLRMLDPNLKSLIENLLLDSSNPEDLKIAFFILKTYRENQNKELKPSMLHFFTSLITHDLVKAREICAQMPEILQKFGENIFFQCISTKKTENYSAENLFLIVSTFHRIAKKITQSLSTYSHFPCYDEGGKDLLEQLEKNPGDAAKILHVKEQLQTTSHSMHASSAFGLKQILDINGKFVQIKSAAIQYLASLSEKNRQSMQIYIKVFNWLEDDPKNRQLQQHEKGALIKLILITTANPAKQVKQYSFIELKNVVYQAKQIHDEWGEEALIPFCQAPDLLENGSLENLIKISELLHQLSDDLSLFSNVQLFLDNFFKGTLTLSQFLEKLKGLKGKVLLEKLPDESGLTSTLKRFAGDDPNVSFPLPDDKLKKIGEQYVYIQQKCDEWQQLTIEEMVKNAFEIKRKEKLEESDVLQLIAIGRLGLRIKRGLYPNYTQVLTVLGLLQYGTGCIAQKKTGEGKTLTVALLQFILKMQEREVHFASANSYLAKTAQKEFQEFFRVFGLTTSHISKENPDPDKFKKDILYGTVSDFKFAIMEEMLYGEKLFPSRPKGKKERGVIIIDEADNITLDTAQSSARSSYPPDVSYEWVYRPIFDFAKSTKREGSPLQDEPLERLKEHLQKYNHGKFAEKAKQLPNENLQDWLSNARKAADPEFKDKVKYTTGKVLRSTGTISDGILVLDSENTRRVINGSRWSGGFHEFLEVKHGFEVEKESLNPLSMPDAVFYQIYEIVYGLTGTMGSAIERQEVRVIYQIDSFDVPTHNPPQRINKPTILFRTKEEHNQAIISRVQECKKRGQPILVHLKTIESSEVMGERLQSLNFPFELLNEKQKKSEEEVVKLTGEAGAILLATTAGRGTDIKLSKESLQNGGLYSLLTFDAGDREKAQCDGRAGRQTDPGVSETLLCAEEVGIDVSNLEENLNWETHQNQILAALERIRLLKTSLAKNHHSALAYMERYFFNFVKEFFSRIKAFSDLMDEDHFLEEYAKALSGRKFIDAKKPEFANLLIKDKRIAEDAFMLLTTDKNQTLHWKGLLKQIARRVKDRIIIDWSKNVNEKVHVVIQNAGFEQHSKQLTTLEFATRIFGDPANWVSLMEKIVGENAREILDQQLAKTKQQIEAVFHSRKPIWDKYLSPSGVIDYLREITGFSLTHLVPGDRQNNSVFLGNHAGGIEIIHSISAIDAFDIKAKSLHNESTHSSFDNNKYLTGLGFNDSSSDQFELGETKEFETEDIDEKEFEKEDPSKVKMFSPPLEGIQVGLPNIQSSCWLNTVIQFIGSTPYYDRMFEDEPSADKKSLHSQLKMILYLLRSGKEVSIGRYKRFLKEIKSQNFLPIGIHNDAPEFLFFLINALQWKPAFLKNKQAIEAINKSQEFPQMGMLFLPIKPLPMGFRKFGSVENYQTHIEITIPEDYAGKELDLSELLRDRGIREIKPDRINPLDKTEVSNHPFKVEVHFTSLPQVIMVYLKRAVSRDGRGNMKKKIDIPVKLDKDGLIPFVKYQPIIQAANGQNPIVGMQAIETCRYRIGASMTQSGNTEGGHYVCEERTTKGQLICHDDMIIQQLERGKEIGKLGYFLRLELVDRKKL